MNVRLLRRIVEIFFQKWPLYLLMLAGLVGFGFYSVTSAPPVYTSSGTIFVDNQSLVSAQSGVQSGSFFSFLSPAQFTSQELHGLLQTDVFMESVLERADVTLPDDPASRTREVGELRSGVVAWASSQNLVRVNVSTPDTDLSYRLVDAIIAEFVQFQIGVDVAESGASEAFFSNLADSYEADLEAARQEVDAALLGVEDIDLLPLSRQAQIERLREAEALAKSRFQTAVEAIENSRLAGLQTETDVRQSYSTFDPPQRPYEPDVGFFDDVLAMLLITVIGIVAALFWPTVSGFTGRSVLFAEEIETSPVLADVPRIRKRLIRLQSVPAPAHESASPFIGAESSSIVEQATRTITFKSRTDGHGRNIGIANGATATPDIVEPVATAAPDIVEPVATAAQPEAGDQPESEPIAVPVVVAEMEPESPLSLVVDVADSEQPDEPPGNDTSETESSEHDDSEVPPMSSWDPVKTIQFNLPPPPPDTDGDTDDGVTFTTRSKHG